MAIFNFQKPDKVIMIDSTDFEGKFEFRPLEPGYGLTVGNALRRVLLSALEGYAITSTRIDGVEHEFSTISGVVEDVTEIILSLACRFQVYNEYLNQKYYAMRFDAQAFPCSFQAAHPAVLLSFQSSAR